MMTDDAWKQSILALFQKQGIWPSVSRALWCGISPNIVPAALALLAEREAPPAVSASRARVQGSGESGSSPDTSALSAE
jgi:hypothetical protein